MRIVGAVVVGIVLLSVGQVASAAEAKRERSEKCLEICDFTFEQCQKETNPKANERCNIDAVRCKNACPFVTVEEPAVPTYRSHQRCVDACQLTYKKCLAKPENKRGGSCAADDVRCEQACPKPPEPAVATVPADPNAPPGTVAPVAAPAPKKKKRMPRVEGGAAPAPVSATPVVVPNERAGAGVPARSEAAAEPVAAPAPASAAARPAPEKRGFFGTLGCFFVSCEPEEGSTPCLLQCSTAYDECHERESKRGGECATRLMHCRNDCRAAGR